MKKRITKAIYSICAAAGFLTAVFLPCYSSAESEGKAFSAAELVYNVQEQEKTVVSASKFEDIDENAWYFPYVDMLVANGVINGTSETTYSPTGNFNAAECAAVITRYLGLESYAAQRQKELAESGAQGAENWYSGYVQTLCDTGIIAEGELGISLFDGFVQITDAQEFARPLKRYEFAVFITRSFDINTELVSAKGIYPEINDNGNHFITGGKYDGSVEYYASYITDYWYIPEDAAWDVLKAYYNGIFNGDEYGNFNPNVAITRSEMSKVVAVIIDPSMRKRAEYRNINELFVIPQEKFLNDGWGEKTLDREYAKTILSEVAKGISADSCAGGFDVSFLPCAYPEGFFVEARFYDKSSGTYTEKLKTELSDSEKVSATLKAPSVLLVLRNSSDAKVEGALRVNVSADGSLEYDDLFKAVI